MKEDRVICASEAPGTSSWARPLYTARWVLAPYSLLDEMRHRFGDVFSVRLSGPLGNRTFFSKPAAIREIFLDAGEQLDAGTGRFYWQALIGKASILALSGQRHLDIRRCLLSGLDKHLLAEHFARSVKLTREAAVRWSRSRSIRVNDASLQLALAMILGSIFPGTDESTRKRLGSRFIETNNLLDGAFGPFMIFVPASRKLPLIRRQWARFRRAQESVNGILDAYVASANAAQESRHFEFIQKVKGEAQENGTELSARTMRDQLLTALVAGYGTTAATISWAIYRLGRHTDIQARLRHMANTSPDTPLIAAFCREVLRMHPVVPWVSRKVKTAMDINGVRLQPGDTVCANTYATHQLSEVYGDPHNFRPERFLERTFTAYEYYPFGGGIRRCIGEAMGFRALTAAVTTLVRDFEIRLLSTRTVRPCRANLAVAPANSFRAVVVDR